MGCDPEVAVRVEGDTVAIVCREGCLNQPHCDEHWDVHVNHHSGHLKLTQSFMSVISQKVEKIKTRPRFPDVPDAQLACSFHVEDSLSGDHGISAGGRSRHPLLKVTHCLPSPDLP